MKNANKLILFDGPRNGRWVQARAGDGIIEVHIRGLDRAGEVRTGLYGMLPNIGAERAMAEAEARFAHYLEVENERIARERKEKPMSDQPQLNQVPATPGRIVHVYGLGRLPLEPLAAIVTSVIEDAGKIDARVVASARVQGWNDHHLVGARLYDPMTPDQRKAMYASDPNRPWAEWLPYQKGQAVKTDELLAEMTRTLEGVQARIVDLEAMVHTGGQASEINKTLNGVKRSLADWQVRDRKIDEILKETALALRDLQARVVNLEAVASDDTANRTGDAQSQQAERKRK